MVDDELLVHPHEVSRDVPTQSGCGHVETSGGHPGGHRRGLTQAEAAHRYEVSETFVSRLLAPLLPKATPRGSTAGTHHRVRHDRIDKTGAVGVRRAGRMHHIGIGRAHAAKTVVLLIDDLDIRVIHDTTGELLRHLTLDYQTQK